MRMQNSNKVRVLSSRSEPYKSTKRWCARVKAIIRSQLNRFPVIYLPTIRMFRTIRLLFFKCKWKLLTLTETYGGERTVDIDKVCWVSPQRIEYCSLREFDVYNFKGRTIAGDWDCLEKKFEDLDVFVALQQVCTEGKSWPDTIFYQRILDWIGRGEIAWDCRDKHDFDRRCKDLELLYEKIKCEGYKLQREILPSLNDYDPLMVDDDEVTVSVGRHGDLLFSNSAHRLAIAKLLAIKEIPIKIAARHPEWIAFRKELLLYAKEQGGKICQPITHPDLTDIPAFHDCDDIFTIIKENISAKRGCLLDIGADLGYSCHRFEDEGFDCYAVECCPQKLHFLKKLKRAESKKFNIIGQSVLECSEIRNIHFNVAFALNIFHHFLKTKESYQKLIELLENLQTEELFFEPHTPGETQMKGAYRDYAPDEFVRFILEFSRLENADFIGQAGDGRKIYKLY